MSWIKEKTKPLRQKIAFSLNPKIKKYLDDIKIQNKKRNGTPRPSTLFCKRYFRKWKKLNVLEVGFGNGLNAKSLLEELNIKELWCIDPFLFKAYNEKDHTHHYKNKTIYEELIKDNRVKFINNYIDVLTEYNYFDFIYIDGNHTLEYVKNDLIKAFNLVKEKGVIGGHDFITDIEFNYYDVIKAVIYFSVEMNIKPQIKIPDYWFIK